MNTIASDSPPASPKDTTTPTGASLLDALVALRSPGNLLLAAVAAVLALLVLAVAAGLVAHGARFVGLIALVLAWLVVEGGYCAITLRRLQRARGEPASHVLAAAWRGGACAVKVLLAMSLLLVALALIMLVASLSFVLTQIPGIGPALDYLVFPLVALVLGVALYALAFIAAPLAAVAACQGRSVFGTVATVVLVIRRRLFDTALRGVLLNLLTLFVIGLAITVVTMGVTAAGAIQHLVQIGHTGSSHAFGAELGAAYDAGDGAPPGLAALAAPLAGLRAIGATSAVLYFLALGLGFVVYAAGWVVIFGETAGDLDPTALEAQMRRQAERAAQKAREAQAQAARLAREHSGKSDKTPPPP
jgi:hypothetical protein